VIVIGDRGERDLDNCSLGANRVPLSNFTVEGADIRTEASAII
jgi:hypothetical protein